MEAFDSNNFTEVVVKAFEKYLQRFNLTEEDLKNSLLDVGAGKGHFIRYVRNAYDNKEAFALDNGDIEEYQISETGDWYIKGDGLHMPFEDNRFRTVTAKAYIQMFTHRSGGYIVPINEMIRVTAPGGKVIFDTWTEESKEKELQRLKTEVTPREDEAEIYKNMIKKVEQDLAIARELKEWIVHQVEEGKIKSYTLEGEVYSLYK